MASLSLKNINKVYPNGFHAVKDFNLEIEDKEFRITVWRTAYLLLYCISRIKSASPK
ncbi:MAG: hypothetical protein J6I65_00475 [Lachnospiraceae bacterium]|nr:hypothetical protein [Lachnospiraceae bacterium]